MPRPYLVASVGKLDDSTSARFDDLVFRCVRVVVEGLERAELTPQRQRGKPALSDMELNRPSLSDEDLHLPPAEVHYGRNHPPTRPELHCTAPQE